MDILINIFIDVQPFKRSKIEGKTHEGLGLFLCGSRTQQPSVMLPLYQEGGTVPKCQIVPPHAVGNTATEQMGATAQKSRANTTDDFRARAKSDPCCHRSCAPRGATPTSRPVPCHIPRPVWRSRRVVLGVDTLCFVYPHGLKCFSVLPKATAPPSALFMSSFTYIFSCFSGLQRSSTRRSLSYPVVPPSVLFSSSCACIVSFFGLE